MPLRNLSENLGDAWKKSVENGQKIDQRIKNNNKSFDTAVDQARNNTLNYLSETDKGLYRPDSNYYFHLKDGGAIRRRRLMEQRSETPEEREKREADKAAADKAAADKAAADAAAAEEPAAEEPAAEEPAAEEPAAEEPAAEEPDNRTDLQKISDKRNAKEAAKKGISVEEHKAQVAASRAKKTAYMQSDAAFEAREAIEAKRLEAANLRKSGDRAGARVASQEMHALRRRASRALMKSGRAADKPTDEQPTSDTTDTTDTGEGGEAESKPAVVIRNGIATPTDAPEHNIDDANKVYGTHTDPVSGKEGEIRLAPPTRMGDAPGKPGSGYDIAGPIEQDVSPEDKPTFSVPGFEGDLSGAPIRRFGKHEGPDGGKVLDLPPNHPSGAKKVKVYNDGRKVITYKDDREETIPAPTGAAAGADAGTAQTGTVAAGAGTGAGTAQATPAANAYSEYLRSKGVDPEKPSEIRAYTAANPNDEQFKELETAETEENDAHWEARREREEETRVDPQNPGAGEIDTQTAPSDVNQPPAAPPSPTTRQLNTGQARRRASQQFAGRLLHGGLQTRPMFPRNENFNPINKYGVYLPETKGPLQK